MSNILTIISQEMPRHLSDDASMGRSHHMPPTHLFIHFTCACAYSDQHIFATYNGFSLEGFERYCDRSCCRMRSLHGGISFFIYDPSHKTYPPHPREHEGYTLALTDDLVPGPTQQEVDQCGHITDCYITTLVAISSGVINSATAQQQVDGGIALSHYKYR